ncbi:MAG TPA: ankyrin repeat domain-containing protein [Chthonomonadaceae bacterium]|nr:ankyrin repeat domain-containing protein [Chthonomonadaceae bacterium]
MKKHRLLLIVLLVLLVVVGLPMGLLVREYRQERLNRELIEAIKVYDPPAVLAALKGGADPNARDYSDDKPLAFREQIKHLWDNMLHANSKAELDVHATALIRCFRVSQEYYKTLRKTQKLLLLDERMTKNNPTLVKALLDAGADPNLGGDGDYPIILASDKTHAPALRLLLQHGGNVRLKDAEGHTALHWAAEDGSMEEVSLLLDAGADCNAQDDWNETPLHWACEWKGLEAVQAMLRHHANPNLRDDEGLTALDWALINDKSETYVPLRKAGAKKGKELSFQSAKPPKH